MKKQYVVSEFADIYDNNKNENTPFNKNIKYFIDRDNFFEIYRSYLRSGDLSKKDMRDKFIRPPKLANKRDYEYAAATALYYINKFGLDSVEWVEDALKEVDKDKEDIVCWFVKKDEDIERERENTPEEFKKFGFIMDEKHISIR